MTTTKHPAQMTPDERFAYAVELGEGAATAAVLVIQRACKQNDGGIAGQFFTPARWAAIVASFRAYAEIEIAELVERGPGPVCVKCGALLTEIEIAAQIPGYDEMCLKCDALPDASDYFEPGGELGAFASMIEDLDADEHTSPNGRRWIFTFEYPGFFTWSTRTSDDTSANINATLDWSEPGEIQIDRDDTTGATSAGLALVKFERLTVLAYRAIVIPFLDAESERLGPPAPELVP